MTRLIRRRTTCTVPGHGTSCEPSRERDNVYERTTEEGLALSFELAANGEDYNPYAREHWHKPEPANELCNLSANDCQLCGKPFDPVATRWLCPHCHAKNSCCM